MSDTYQAVYDATRSKIGGCDAGSAISEAASRAFDISYLIPRVNGLIDILRQDWTWPHVVMRPKVFLDGNQWCALYGDNLQEGVCGFGNTPAQACAEFDREWYKPIAATQPAAGGGE